MRRIMLPALPALLALIVATPLLGQSISGQIFEDLNADGIRQPAERSVPGVDVTAFGAGGESVAMSGADGMFSVAVATGCRGVFLDLAVEPDPATGLLGAAWRRVEADSATCPANGSDPIGRTRYGFARHLRDRMLDPSYLYIQLGDSIAAGVSVCIFTDSDYSPEVAAELDCLGPGSITRNNRGVGGWHSEDLLTPMDGGSPNAQYIPNVVAANPDLVTISIGGNDFLNTEPGSAGQNYPFQPADLQASLQELIHTRRTVQEILSTLVSQLPNADVDINTVYDNLASSCNTTDFHAAMPPLWNQMLRHLAWGQVRPVNVAEVAPEFAHEDIARVACCGEQGRICPLDDIHPNAAGADMIQHAIMESLGRVNVGAGGATNFDVGALPLVAALSPTVARVVQGTPASPDAALILDGAGALLGAGAVLELSGFTLPPGIVPVRIVAGVRYATTAAFTDDTHLFDASLVDFAPPVFTVTGWDTVTPLVGGSGTAGNIGTPSVINALKNVPQYRDVSAMITKNALDDGRATGSYAWPLPDAADVGALKIRLSVNAVGAPDAAQVDWDGAWVWVYGSTSGSVSPPGEVSPPGSATPLLVRKQSGIHVSWGAEPLAETYRVWRGDIGAWTVARCAPGAAGGCVTAPTLDWTEVPPPDSSGPNWYFLVSALNSGGSGPLGNDSMARPRIASAPECP